MKSSTIKRIAAIGLASLMTVGAFASCGDDKGGSSSSGSKKGDASKGSVYYLNFKPEQDEAWQNLAKTYTKATGTKVTVVTAAEGTYEQTLTSELAKDEAPTLFQVNGPVGLAKWTDFCMDLKDTDIYSQLTSQDFALKDGDAVKGIAYVIESYGIIYNKTLLQKYCDSDFASVKSIDDINSFDKLKTVADEIQKNKDKLDGTYLDNYKNIWDLYITDSTCKATELASKTGAEAETEFINGDAVFFQNGSWEYGAVTEGGLKDDDLGMLPIYIGVGDEAKQGLCTGTENYWCINDEASDDDKAATAEFINWCVTSDEGTAAMADKMGFVIPFKAAKESTNVFVKIDKELTEAGKTPVSWNFTTMPSEDWKDGVGAALTQYAAGTGDWDAVKKAFVDNWATEKAKTAEE